jgi:hypothetical protein
MEMLIELTEAGPRPDFAEMFGDVEMPGAATPSEPGPTPATRTGRSDSGTPGSPAGGRRSGPVPASGSRSTWFEGLTQSADVVAWIETDKVLVLNVGFR